MVSILYGKKKGVVVYATKKEALFAKEELLRGELIK